MLKFARSFLMLAWCGGKKRQILIIKKSLLRKLNLMQLILFSWNICSGIFFDSPTSIIKSCISLSLNLLVSAWQNNGKTIVVAPPPPLFSAAFHLFGNSIFEFGLLLLNGGFLVTLSWTNKVYFTSRGDWY